ncbi:MAG: fatty acyl-AMP ligase [Acidobacteriota bacterium]
MSATLATWLERAAGFPDRGLRFLDRAERATWLGWDEIHARSRRLAGGLLASGIAPGERVALVFPTSPEFVLGFFATLLAGAVPVPLYPPARLGRLDEYHAQTARLLLGAGCRLVLADPRVRRLLGESLEAARPELGCRTLEELPAAAESAIEVAPQDLGLVQFSSGTTFQPKPVALSHRALLAQVRILNGFWPDSPELVHSGVSWLPLYHDMGLIGGVLCALERPGTLTLIGPEAFVARPALWLRAISRYRATISPAPNFAYGLCAAKVRDEELDGVDLSSWRVALNGAEPVAPEVLRAFCQRFAPFGFRAAAMTPVYGLSEAALAVTFSALDRPFRSARFDRAALARGEVRESADGREIVAVGRPVPGFSIELRGEGGTLTPAGRVGRIFARGPSLMQGYLGQPEATTSALRDGWLDTGDLGFVHDGELYLTGRAKDVLILRGRNHAPEDVEQALVGLDGARAGCAVAASYLPEGSGREVLAVFVEHRREAANELRQSLPRRVSDAVLARAGLVVDEVHVLAPGTLPRTSSGKLRRGETVRRHLAGDLVAPAAVTWPRLAGALWRSRRALGRAARVASHPDRGAIDAHED